MLKKIYFLTLLFFVVFSVASVYAADTGVVTATVTAQNVSVTVSDGTVNYGTLPTSSYRTTLPDSPGLNDQQTATNNGNVTENFNIKGQDSANWILSETAIGADTYMHKFCIATCGSEASPGAGFTALTTSYTTLQNGVAPSGTRTFDLQLLTPSSSTNYTQQSVNVTVQAVAQ